MQTSIATVSISGDLREKLAAIASAGFDGVEIFENDFLAFDGTPAEVGAMVRDHGLTITLFQPFRDFEGMPEPHRSRAFDRAERKFDLMQQLGTDLMLICSNISPLVARRDRPRGRRFPRARRAGCQARPARRLRGARLGPPHQRPSRRLGDRPPGRSSQYRPHPRQLPHAVAQHRRRIDPRHPRRSHLHRPARRRAAHGHGPPVVEPALPQHARRG